MTLRQATWPASRPDGLPPPITPLPYGRIFLFWVPLAATWLMMSAEGPFLAAVIARVAEPVSNLAAFGVAYAFALLAEAPVIMMMSASTALVDSPANFRRLRAFTYLLNVVVTLLLALLVFTPLFGAVMEGLIGLPEEVARLTHTALILMLPWPAAIGYRRFYQGLLIRDDLTRRVAFGTVVRLAGMAGTALLLFAFTSLPGAWVAASALSSGVVLEAAASRLMAYGTVRRMLTRQEKDTQTPVPMPRHRIHDADGARPPLSWGEILRFYWPLALTSIVSLAIHPMAVFFIGQARYPVESLAVLPVVNALTFIFRSLGLSYQEVGIALAGPRREHVSRLARFALGLALAASAALALLAWSPLARFWFETVSGLSPELTAFAIPPTQILALFPGLAVLLSFQRALLVSARMTRAISWATFIEAGGIALVMTALIALTSLNGATIAAIAFVAGRLAGNVFLVPPCLEAARPLPEA